jgi:hypothetical protein
MALRQLAAPFDDYDSLVQVIRARLSELGTTCESASALGGLTETHISKIVCPARVRVLGRMSFTTVLQVLGIKLTATVDDEAYAPLAARLMKSTFNRWNRELRVRVDDVGGVAAVKASPELLAAVSVPVAEPKPKPEVKRSRYNPDEPHPLPVRSRPRFGRGQQGAAA